MTKDWVKVAPSKENAKDFAKRQQRGKQLTELLKITLPDGSKLIEDLAVAIISSSVIGRVLMNKDDFSWAFIQGYYYPKFLIMVKNMDWDERYEFLKKQFTMTNTPMHFGKKEVMNQLLT